MLRDQSAACCEAGRSVQGVLLRRTKYTSLDGQPILNLPPCRQTQECIDLDDKERAFYDDLKRQSQDVVSGLRAGASGCAGPPPRDVHVITEE